jgi:hypothetical protein
MKSAAGTTTSKVVWLPTCDFCAATAQYDGRTRRFGWARMCWVHFAAFGVGLGTGKGQKLVVADAQESWGID